MPTYTEMFDAVRNWRCSNGFDYGARVADAEAYPGVCTRRPDFVDLDRHRQAL